MPRFGRKRDSRASGALASRRIPALNPGYFESIHRAIQDFGGTDSLADVAYGIANAIENTAPKYFAAIADPRAGSRFDQEFGNHGRDDLDAADRMIDWLLRWDAASEEPLEELLARLKEVLSRPPR